MRAEKQRKCPLPMRRLLDAEQAASYCNVSAPTFELRFGVMPIRVGTRKLYDVQDIDKAIESMKRNAANDNVAPDKYNLLEAL